MSEEPVETVERLSAEAVSEAVEATDEKAAEEKPPAIQAEEGAIEDGEAGEMAGEQAGGRSSLKKDGTPRRSSARASVVIVSQEVLPTGEDKEISEEGQLEQGEAEIVQKTAALGKMDSMEAFMGEQEGEEYGEMIDVEPMDKRILLVGNCVMDYVLICDRYPAEDSDRRALDGYWQRGGNASNNATVLRQLNAPVEFFGVLSQSDAFACLLEDCYNRGIIIDHCPRVPAHPPFSSVMLSEATGTRTIVHCNQNFPYVTFEQFKSLGDLRQYMWVHFEARNVTETMNMMKMLWSHNERHEHKIQISLDLEVVSKETLKLAPYADINILGKDLARFMGWNDPVKACKGFRTHIQSAEEELGHRSLIVVPWSEQGAVCMDYENNVHIMPAYPPPVIHDTLGAGDTFTGALIHALCVQEMFLREAVDFANRVAGYKCGHRGYDAISKMPIDQFNVRADDEEDF